MRGGGIPAQAGATRGADAAAAPARTTEESRGGGFEIMCARLPFTASPLPSFTLRNNLCVRFTLRSLPRSIFRSNASALRLRLSRGIAGNDDLPIDNFVFLCGLYILSGQKNQNIKTALQRALGRLNFAPHRIITMTKACKQKKPYQPKSVLAMIETERRATSACQKAPG